MSKQEIDMTEQQKTVIVTGASQGIGAAVVNLFLDRGYNVVGNSRNIEKKNQLPRADNLAVVGGDESNMSIEKILYQAQAKATGGGRDDGRTVSSDGALDLHLTRPRELGGPGGTGTNPEQLFAAGYSACFLSAMKFVARRDKIAIPADTSVESTIGIGAIPNGFGIEAELRVSMSHRRTYPADARRGPVPQRKTQSHREVHNTDKKFSTRESLRVMPSAPRRRRRLRRSVRRFGSGPDRRR
jgi:Ohr subfamily peroxiredoxin